VVFTTIQKFLPEEWGDRHPVLSERRNIVVIADEAHRSPYDFIDGFARHMRDALPNASFIQRAVEDGATMPIYYESRLAKLALEEAEKPRIDPEFEEVTEDEEIERKERLKSKWAQLEAIVGSERRLKLIAADIVEHFETRLEAMVGKAMVVCMSRRICVELYREIVTLRPDWHHDDDDRGTIKAVMTGSAVDPLTMLKTIARKFTESVRRNVSIDWTVRENVRTQMRVRVKRILRMYGYPPYKQEQAA
jgi:type I restriction enzyme R subunit